MCEEYVEEGYESSQTVCENRGIKCVKSGGCILL